MKWAFVSVTLYIDNRGTYPECDLGIGTCCDEDTCTCYSCYCLCFHLIVYNK